jgi:hypothetical protein
MMLVRKGQQCHDAKLATSGTTTGNAAQSSPSATTSHAVKGRAHRKVRASLPSYRQGATAASGGCIPTPAGWNGRRALIVRWYAARHTSLVYQATRRDPIRRDRRRTSHLVYTATVNSFSVCLLPPAAEQASTATATCGHTPPLAPTRSACSFAEMECAITAGDTRDI